MDGLAQNVPLIAGGAIVAVALIVALVFLGRSKRPETRTIRVIGVGGGGSNAVDHMIRSNTTGVDFIACNTDAQALRQSAAPQRLRIGDGVTHGLGTGGDPAVGQRAAEEDADRITRVLDGSDLVFVTAGLGGGTGSGAGPVVAGIARKAGALTVGVVTKPFAFEGSGRRKIADTAARELAANVDALITIPNDRVAEVVRADDRLVDAFGAVDEVLRSSVQGVIDVVRSPGLINLDFADVRAVMQDGGPALIGIGRATGDNRTVEAARQAMASPLLEASFRGSRSILFNVAGSKSVGFGEVTRAAEAIREAADPEANVIFGTSFNDELGEEVVVTLIAAGHDGTPMRLDKPATTMPVPASPPAETDRPMTALAEPRTQTDEKPGRRRGGPSKRRRQGTAPEIGTNGSLEDDLDVPSFLRRRASGRAGDLVHRPRTA
jgi:cell division protein FtsZ